MRDGRPSLESIDRRCEQVLDSLAGAARTEADRIREELAALMAKVEPKVEALTVPTVADRASRTRRLDPADEPPRPATPLDAVPVRPLV